jgi:hypothetical protein
MKSRSWEDLTPVQRTGAVAAGAVQLALLGAALADLRRRSPEELRGGKGLWKAAVFVNYVGPIAYFLVGRRH